ncbi:MAG: DUF4105 domain-containing protein [Elusimicrobia bacterium]|nr:DUF4105 domain-containing protein [Elusimicrobiota bacterium]
MTGGPDTPGRRRAPRLAGLGLACLAGAGALAWAAAALFIDLRAAPPLRALAAAAYLGASLWALAAFKARGKGLWGVLAGFCLVLGWWLALKPSDYRPWQPDAARTPWAEVSGDTVTVHNVRNCDYRAEFDYTPRWETRSYGLSKIRGVDVMFTYWSNPRIAHVVVSFPFEGGKYLDFSIETRKEEGEEYSNFLGFFRQYELLYVAADERDVVRLRTNYRKGEETYLYRTTATPEYARELFLKYVRRMNRAHGRPQWFSTLTNNCTTNVAAMAGEPRLDWRVIFSGLADRMLYDQGKLETGGLSFDALKAQAHINDAARAADKAPDFSARIRAGRAGF